MVVWSDESFLQQVDGWVRVCQFPGEHLHQGALWEECNNLTIKFWGMASALPSVAPHL